MKGSNFTVCPFVDQESYLRNTYIPTYIHTYIHTVSRKVYLLSNCSRFITPPHPNRTSTLTDFHSLNYTYCDIGGQTSSDNFIRASPAAARLCRIR